MNEHTVPVMTGFLIQLPKKSSCKKNIISKTGERVILNELHAD